MAMKPSQVSNYGVFDVEATDDDRVKKVVGMVEKPVVESAPSDVVATGRYLLVRVIFGALRRITSGKSGELQLTEPSLSSFPRGTPLMSWSIMASRGLGNPGGFIPASVERGLHHSKYGLAFYAELGVPLEKYRGEVGQERLRVAKAEI